MAEQPMTFGQKLALLRDAKGLTDQKLSEGLEVDLNYLIDIIDGKEHPSRDMVLTLTDDFDFSIDETNELLKLAGLQSLTVISPISRNRRAPRSPRGGGSDVALYTALKYELQEQIDQLRAEVGELRQLVEELLRERR